MDHTTVMKGMKNSAWKMVSKVVLSVFQMINFRRIVIVTLPGGDFLALG